MVERSINTLRSAIDAIFDEPRVPAEIALQLLDSWIENLRTTETLINRQLLAFIGLFLGFLSLDMGVLAKLAFEGAELHRVGLVLCAASIALAYFYYRSMSAVCFAHDLRTAIAILYKNLHAPVYFGGLDLFAHIASVRNLEAYDSLRAPSGWRIFYERTTDIVTIVQVFGPIVGIAYCILRLWSYQDISIGIWVVTTTLILILVLRALLFGVKQTTSDEFSGRRRPSSDQQA